MRKTEREMKKEKNGVLQIVNKPLETIYISNKQFEDILRKLLLIKQYRVEVWKKQQKISNEMDISLSCKFERMYWLYRSGISRAHREI